MNKQLQILYIDTATAIQIGAVVGATTAIGAPEQRKIAYVDHVVGVDITFR